MRSYRCILIELGFPHGRQAGLRATIQRLEAHQFLGEVRETLTITSKVRMVSFDHGFLITQNSIYVFDNRLFPGSK